MTESITNKMKTKMPRRWFFEKYNSLRIIKIFNNLSFNCFLCTFATHCNNTRCEYTTF